MKAKILLFIRLLRLFYIWIRFSAHLSHLFFLLSISLEIMDRFWWSRCLNNHIEVPDMMGSFASSITASLVAKKETKKFSQPLNKFWCSRCLNNHIEVPDMIGSFSSGTTTSLVAKNRTEKLSQLFEDRFWFSNCLNYCIKVPNIIGSFATSASCILGYIVIK